MKNTVKMSLAAALAVSALSTSASAGNLEEMIKDVSVSGKMEVEYDYGKSKTEGSDASTTNGWDYDLDFTAKVPVNDNITAVIGFDADNGVDKTDGPNVSQRIDDDNMNITKTYFQYANAGATVMVGKQGVGTPFLDDERGNGVVGMYNAGAVTVAAAHFTGVNSGALAAPKAADGTTGTDIGAAALIGSFAGVNASVWYVDASNVADAYSINANTKFDMVSVDVNYAEADYENTSNDAKLGKIVVAAGLEGFTPYVGYGYTGKHNADSTAGVDFTSDSDADTNFGTEQLFIDDLNDADALLIGITVPMGAMTFDVSYVDGDFKENATTAAAYGGTADTESDFDELLVKASYAMSKNCKITGFYSDAEIAKTDTDSASVAIEYKF